MKLIPIFALALALAACGGKEKDVMQSTVCCDSHLNSSQKLKPSCVVIDSSDVTACPAAQGFGVAFVVESEAGPVAATATLTRNFTPASEQVVTAPGACALYGVVSPPGTFAQCLQVVLTPSDAAQVRPGAVTVPADQPAQGVVLCDANDQCRALQSEGATSSGAVVYGPVMSLVGIAADLQGVSTPAVGEVGAAGLGVGLLGVAMWKMRPAMKL